jgi:hypothetical protein
VGIQNVTRAFDHWGHLGHKEMRMLLYMAKMTKDDAQPPVYYAGWEVLSMSLGLDYRARPESAKRNVMATLGKLRSAGAVVSSGSAHSGVRAEYALCLNPETGYAPEGVGRNVTWIPVERVNESHTQKGERITHPPVNDSYTQKGERIVPERVNESHTPRKSEEDPLGRTEEALPIVNLPAAVSKSDPGKPDTRSQTPEHRATDDAYAKTGKAFNFIATRQIAKWAIHDRGKSEAQVSEAIVSSYRAGKPITKQVIGQYLDGITKGSPAPAGKAPVPAAYWMHNS